MNIADVFKDRAAAKLLLDPSHPRFVTGSEADQAKARAQWRADRFLHQLMSSDLSEIPRSDLRPFRPGVLEDQRTGQFWKPHRGELVDLTYLPGAAAYFIAADGHPVVLEKPPGPQTRDELEARRAANEQRRAEQAKIVPAWKR
jgi:hypothetical protein